MRECVGTWQECGYCTWSIQITKADLEIDVMRNINAIH